MVAKLRKKPSDYPLFSFRIEENEKERLMERARRVASLADQKRDEDEYKIRTNDILLEALQIGLERLEQKYRNR